MTSSQPPEAMFLVMVLVVADQAHIDGTARCSYTRNGVSFVGKGDWLANREE